MTMEEFIRKYGTRTPILLIERAVLSPTAPSPQLVDCISEMLTGLHSALEDFQKRQLESL